MISRSILSNYLGSLFGLAVSKGLRFAGVVYCIRMVGDYTWGQTVSTIALLSFLAFIIDQGLSGSPLLYHLRSRVADARLLRMISGYRLSMAVLFVAAIHLFHRVIVPLDELVLVYAFVLIPRALAVDWWFHRREQYQVTTYIASVRTLVFFGLVLVFVRPGAGAETLLFIEMAAEAVSIAFGYIMMRFSRAGATPDETGPEFGLGDLLRFSFPFLLIALLNQVQVSMDIVLLRFFLGSEVTAQYDVGIKIGFLYFFVGATFVQIIRPKLTRLYQTGDLARVGHILRTTSSLLLLAGSLLLLPSFYFSGDIISLLYNRDGGLPAFVFQWAALWVGVSFMTMLGTDTLLSLGKRRFYLYAAGVCAVVNIAGNLVLLQVFGGHGAIFAKILSEAAFLVAALAFIPREVRSTFAASLGFQFLVLAGFVVVLLGSAAFDAPMAGFALSLAGCGLIVWRGRVFSHETFAVLRDN